MCNMCNMGSKKCKILSDGKYLRVRVGLSGPSLTLVDAQNDGQGVPDIHYWRKCNKGNDSVLHYGFILFHDKKKYLLVVERAGLKLKDLSSVDNPSPDSSNDSHWFQKVDLTGGMFGLKPVTQPSKYLAVTEKKASLVEVDFAVFTSKDV